MSACSHGSEGVFLRICFLCCFVMLNQQFEIVWVFILLVRSIACPARLAYKDSRGAEEKSILCHCGLALSAILQKLCSATSALLRLHLQLMWWCEFGVFGYRNTHESLSDFVSGSDSFVCFFSWFAHWWEWSYLFLTTKQFLCANALFTRQLLASRLPPSSAVGFVLNWYGLH